MHDQIYSYLDKIFSIDQCGFCKGISTQHILLTMIEKMKISRDNKQCCAATLTDFSKVGSSFSKELDILCCVPQGSILDPLLSNKDICDLFFIDMSSNIAN